jgi:hypothetical protein
MSVPHNCLINDIREPSTLRGYSFSKFKKTDVKKQFLEMMLNGKIEPACYWCAELVCAGHYGDIWEIIFIFVGKYIHTANPKIAIYLEKRYTVFRNIMMQGAFLNEVELRNNSTIRTLFAEIITIITLSVKKNSFESVKIKRENEFDITQMKERLKAPNIKFAENILHPDDPKEIYIAVNEFSYHIGNKNSNMLQACYWIEWLIEFEIICRKRKQPCICKRRSVNVDAKYQCDVMWVLWDSLIYYSKNAKVNPEMAKKLLISLKELFTAKYTPGSGKKRKFLLYFAVELITEHYSLENELFTQHTKRILESVTQKINLIYKQIKKNEESPNADYLFNNLDTKNNFERSMKQLDLLNSVDTMNTANINMKIQEENVDDENSGD